METEKSNLYKRYKKDVSTYKKGYYDYELWLENKLIEAESELKKLRVTDVSGSVCYCGKPSVEECEPCCSLACALKPKMYR
jgi:hypothetical protein